MTSPIATFSGGIHSLVEAGIRADGQVFKRYQDKTSWGYRWGAWRKEGLVDPQNIPATLPSGFSTLSPTYGGVRKWRLPR